MGVGVEMPLKSRKVARRVLSYGLSKKEHEDLGLPMGASSEAISRALIKKIDNKYSKALEKLARG